ncbi:MAG: hypothetical protein HY331_16615 [Chloroflexi bacterium]|nr:hypothetical protein [Chloroflexota bacterium]
MEDLSSLKSKVEKLARERQDDQALLDLLTIVLCLNGKVSGLSPALLYYRSYWGQNRLNQVVEVLAVQEAVLEEGPESLRYGYQRDLQIRHPQPELVAGELADLLFKERRAHYDSLLEQVRCIDGGEDYLRVLAKAGPDLDEGVLGYAYKVLSGKPLDRIRRTLTENALLIFEWSGRRHDRYRLLPQLVRIVLSGDTGTRVEPPSRVDSTPVAPPNPHEPPQPAGPFQITFPPHDNGTGLVFGRGPLKDRLVLGIEAGKPFSVEHLVTLGLHNINQPHVGVFQQIRTGKSTLAGSIMLQAAFQGVPVVAIDPKPDYVSNLIPVAETIARYPDHKESVEARFREARQDIRGFDLARDVEFEQDGKQRRVRFQVFTFRKELQQLPNCTVLKLPLLVLPPLHDRDFEDQCNAAATNLVGRLKAPKGRALNKLLAMVMMRFKQNNQSQEWMLMEHVRQELAVCAMQADREDRRRIDALQNALEDYHTANSYLYAGAEKDVMSMDSVVSSPDFADGDQRTVTISIVDVSTLPQDRRNPVMLNYVSQVCAQLYTLVGRKRSPRPTKLLVVFDEAQNYLPDGSDPYNYARVIMNRGASLGIKALLMAQVPQTVEMEARRQCISFVVSKVSAATVRDVFSTQVQDDSWIDKLEHLDPAQALMVTPETGKVGGKVCVPFSTPQTVAMLAPREIAELLKRA